MRRRGIIVEKTNKEMLVEIQDPTRTCGSCKGCIKLTPDRPPEDYIVRVPSNRQPYEVGDEVIVDGQMAPMVKAVVVLYGIPFILLFVGYFLTRLIAKSDPVAGLGAIVGLLIGAVVAKALVRRFLNAEPEFRIVARACS